MENTTNEYILNDNERLVRPSFASIQKLEEAVIVHCCFVQRIIVFYVDISSCASCGAKPKSSTMFTTQTS